MNQSFTSTGSVSETPVCLICYTDDLPNHRAVLACGHDNVCGLCHLRLRSLHSDTKCPMCKSSNDKVVVDADEREVRGVYGDGEVDDDDDVQEEEQQVVVRYHHKSYGEYPIWGEELGGDFVYRQDVGMFFRREYYEQTVLALFSLSCQEPGCDFTNDLSDTYVREGGEGEDDNNNNGNGQDVVVVVGNGDNNGGNDAGGGAAGNNNNARGGGGRNNKKRTDIKRVDRLQSLKEHLRMKHSLQLCNLCVEFKRDFISLLPRMNHSQMKSHLTKGDGQSSGFGGHPVCEFCRPRRFYDLTKLHEHLNKDHYKCHVCDKQGMHNQFFKNYDMLSRHFDREHFLCHDAQCIAARFVVFENEIDLRAHEVSVHGGNSARTGQTSTKINLEFRVRRTGYDGGGYERREELPSEEDFQYGLDGEAFVPEELPSNRPQQVNEPVFSDPTHAARTAQIRAEAMRVRAEAREAEQEAAFPTLQEASGGAANSGGGSQPLLGWSSATSTALGRGRGQGTAKEAFPALGGASGPRAHGRVKKVPPPKSNNQALWAAVSSTASASAASATPSSSSAAAFIQPGAYSSASGLKSNNASNLSANNFPSLGRPSSNAAAAARPAASSQVRYAAAESFAKKNRSKGPSASALASTDNFPSLGGGGGTPSTGITKKPGSSNAKKVAPTVSSQNDFPSLGGPSSKKGPSATKYAAAEDFVKKKANRREQSEDSKAQLDEMKLILGKEKYKQLKSYTREFASRSISPETFVDRAASLFDGGTTDSDFVSLIPSLIRSCPDEGGRADRALSYLRSLQMGSVKLDDGGQSAPVRASPGKKIGDSKWSSASTAVTAAPPSSTSASISSLAPPPGYRAAPPPTGYSSVASTIGHQGRTSAAASSSWGAGSRTVGGAGGKSVWAAGKGKPGKSVGKARSTVPAGTSVMSAAAQEGPQVGTATSFMAQEKKQKQYEEAQQNGTPAGKGKKKKKQKDELKNLAFGGK